MIWNRKDRDGLQCYTCLRGKNGCKKRVPKGYIPVVVGGDEMGKKEGRFLVHIKLFNEPFVAALLELSAEQFGYQQGVLRVSCDVHSFQQTIDFISQGR